MADRFAELSLAARSPGLAIIPTADPCTGGDELALGAAAQAGAGVVVLEGLGHWWMLQDPQRGAEVLVGFWAAF